ncbi:phage tail sheath C-terminal domain-containing protein [Streptomyces olivoreticuli]
MSPLAPTAPGVYVKEVPSGTRTITSADTSIAAFLGFAPTGPFEPTLVKNWHEYTDRYQTTALTPIPAPTRIPAVFTHENRPQHVAGLIVDDFFPGSAPPASTLGNFYLVSKDAKVYKCDFETGELEEGRPIAEVFTESVECDAFLGFSERVNSAGRTWRGKSTFAASSTISQGRIRPFSISELYRNLPAGFEGNWDAFDGYAGCDYIFKGSGYAVIDSIGAPVGLARRISEGFPGLPSYFHRDLDGVVAWEGVMYFFKDGKTAAAVPGASFLEAAVSGHFMNGGGPCYVSRIREFATSGFPLTKAQVLECFAGTSAMYPEAGLAGLERAEEVTMVAAPGLWSVPEVADAEARRVQQAMVSHCASMGNRMAVLDPPPDLLPDSVKAYAEGLGLPEGDRPFGTLYYPWLRAGDRAGHVVPPSGHMTGVWCRTDALRGVHKAPANETVSGVAGVEWALTDEEQGPLNTVGVNCIRPFPGQSICVWGARTLAAPVSTDWKYLNVRRLCSFIGESIRQGTRWAVFEPNDERLWVAVRANTTAFLRNQWRTGALVGTTPDEAFYVVCDATNNPPDSMAQGSLICDVGIAPTRPAEFITLHISQTMTTPT